MNTSVRFGQLYVAAPDVMERLNRHHEETGGNFNRASGKLLQELTGDETIPDRYPVSPPEKAPLVMTPLPDGRLLIATNKGQQDKDEFWSMRLFAIDYAQAWGVRTPSISETADSLLLRRHNEGADVRYIGYEWLA